MSRRKQLLRGWSKERVRAFLDAERGGLIREVPGGWLVDGCFTEEIADTGSELTSYLLSLAEREREPDPEAEL